MCEETRRAPSPSRRRAAPHHTDSLLSMVFVASLRLPCSESVSARFCVECSAALQSRAKKLAFFGEWGARTEKMKLCISRALCVACEKLERLLTKCSMKDGSSWLKLRFHLSRLPRHRSLFEQRIVVVKVLTDLLNATMINV